MLHIYDSLKSLITPELVSKASIALGEDSSKVSSAVSSIVPGFLGGLLNKGNTSELQNVLEDAGRSNVLSNTTNLFSDNISTLHESVGSRFANALFGNRLDEFNNVIGNHVGISNSRSSKLTSILAPVIAAFLGNKMVSKEYTLNGLLDQLNKEKSSFIGLIPSGLNKVYGVSSLSDLGYVETKQYNKYANTGLHNNPETPKTNFGWLKWVLLLGLLLLLFLWWRSCRTPDTIEDTRTTVVANDTVVDRVDTARTNLNERTSTDIDLPNGERISGYRDGIEERMITYLKSGKYSDAKDVDLKDTWYEFDNIEFKYGSATELTEDSYPQLQNIANILKQYGDVKVKVAGHTDKVGNAEANMKLSQQRANTVKSILEKNGVKAQNISAEGYGEEFASHKESDSNEDRGEDRNIALRFTK